MTQYQLDCAVARATGETLPVIAHLGFGLLADHGREDDDNDLLALACPFCGTTILLSATGPEDLPAVAECRRCDTIFEYRDGEVFACSLAELEQPAPRSFVPAA